MAKQIAVVARVVLLCERVFEKNGSLTLENPLTSLVLPPGVEEKIQLPPFCLYAQITGGLGSAQLSVQVRAFDSNFVLGRSKPVAVTFPDNRVLAVERVFRFTGLRLPRAELYEFQLFANYHEIDDGAAYLRVELGETK
jgi:hypothetical protein